MPTKQRRQRAAEPRPTPIDEIDTDDIMAAFRQAARGRGSLERDELLKEVSVDPRLPAARPEDRGGAAWPPTSCHPPPHHRNRRSQAGASRDRHDGRLRPGRTAGDIPLRHAKGHELRTGRRDPGPRPLPRLRPSNRHQPRRHQVAINSAIRQGILGYEGSVVWREE